MIRYEINEADKSDKEQRKAHLSPEEPPTWWS